MTTQSLRYRPLSKAVCHTAYSAETIRAEVLTTQLSNYFTEDDNRTAAHPTRMLVLQDGFLCCFLLRWSKSRFPRPTTVTCLPRPHRGVFHRKVKEGRVSEAVLGLPLSTKLKETNTPKSSGMTHRIHYKFLVYHCHGFNCG